MSLEARLPTSDMHPRTEAGEQPDQFSGLHARLLLADKDFMNPDKEYPRYKKRVKDLAHRNYQPFELTTDHNRNTFWKQMVETDQVEDSTTAKYALWEETLVNGINTLSTEKRSNVFDPLLQQMGIEKAEGNQTFTDNDARIIYDRYFSKEQREKDPKHSGVKQFVRDVLDTHTKNEKVDMNNLTQHLPDIKKFAVIFGEKSAEMIEQLIFAEAKLKNDSHFVKKLSISRKNNLQPEERRILEHINTVYQEEKAERKQTLEEKLPLMKEKDMIKNEIRNKNRILLIGGTGSGKTVGFPFLVREIMQEDRDKGIDPGKFIITEPTVINTENLTKKIASDGVATLGEEVDYQHGRREDSFNHEADTILMTQKSLSNRILRKDRSIANIKYLMIDEAHALSTDTVILMGLAKRLGVKLFVASATIDEEKFQEYLGVDHIVKIPGEIQKIEGHFIPSPVELSDMPQKAAEVVKQIIENGAQGDIIDFIPGTPDIETTIGAMERTVDTNSATFMGLHSKSSDKEKDDATKPADKNKRRVIVSTNFAETGITIPGLKYVTDTGLKKEMRYDSETKTQRLMTVKASRDECMQRRGRVGRVEPGEWYPLYTEDDFNGHSKDGTGQERPLHIEPEILQTDLKETILWLKSYDEDIRDLDLLYIPDDKSLDTFENDLVAIGALKKINGRTQITEIGKVMAKMQKPEDIHVKRMLADAKISHPEMLDDVLTIAALLDGKSPLLSKEKLEKTGKDLIDKTSDFITLLNSWDEYMKQPDDTKEQWAEVRGLNPHILAQVEERKHRLATFNKLEIAKEERERDTTKLQAIIHRSYADRLMKRNDGKDSYTWEGEYANDVDNKLSKDSLLSEQELPEYIISTSSSPINEYPIKEKKIDLIQTRRRTKEKSIWVTTGTGKGSYISNVQAVKPEWLNGKLDN